MYCDAGGSRSKRCSNHSQWDGITQICKCIF
ncbi:MAG: hypothetical protein ACI4EN_05440 [Butyrivibrio sp.]